MFFSRKEKAQTKSSPAATPANPDKKAEKLTKAEMIEKIERHLRDFAKPLPDICTGVYPPEEKDPQIASWLLRNLINKDERLSTIKSLLEKQRDVTEFYNRIEKIFQNKTDPKDNSTTSQNPIVLKTPLSKERIKTWSPQGQMWAKKAEELEKSGNHAALREHLIKGVTNDTA